MDVSPVTEQIWGTLGSFLPLMLLIGHPKSPLAEGYIGERLVRLFAHWQLDKKTYRSQCNVPLNSPDTTQIDHVFLSRYGLFVVETKNMNGWIFGSEKQAQWTQKLYKRAFKLQKPSRQNCKHLEALEATLGVNTQHLHSVMTFVGCSTFKAEVPANVTHREHVQRPRRRSDWTAERECPKCGCLRLIRSVSSGPSGPKAGQQFWDARHFPSAERCKIFERQSWIVIPHSIMNLFLYFIKESLINSDWRDARANQRFFDAANLLSATLLRKSPSTLAISACFHPIAGVQDAITPSVVA